MVVHNKFWRHRNSNNGARIEELFNPRVFTLVYSYTALSQFFKLFLCIIIISAEYLIQRFEGGFILYCKENKEIITNIPPFSLKCLNTISLFRNGSVLGFARSL